jgi:hypothetical protein
MDTLSFTDVCRLERNRSLTKQTESLRGLTFTMLGNTAPQFVIFTTEITIRGDTQIGGICTHIENGEFVSVSGLGSGFDFIPGQIYKFALEQISIDVEQVADRKALATRFSPLR